MTANEISHEGTSWTFLSNLINCQSEIIVQMLGSFREGGGTGVVHIFKYRFAAKLDYYRNGGDLIVVACKMQ